MTKKIFFGCVLLAIALFAVYKVSAWTITYPFWYTYDPSIVTVNMNYGTMKAISHGTTNVCVALSSTSTQCFMVTVL